MSRTGGQLHTLGPRAFHLAWEAIDGPQLAYPRASDVAVGSRRAFLPVLMGERIMRGMRGTSAVPVDLDSARFEKDENGKTIGTRNAVIDLVQDDVMNPDVANPGFMDRRLIKRMMDGVNVAGARGRMISISTHDLRRGIRTTERTWCRSFGVKFLRANGGIPTTNGIARAGGNTLRGAGVIMDGARGAIGTGANETTGVIDRIILPLSLPSPNLARTTDGRTRLRPVRVLTLLPCTLSRRYTISDLPHRR
jgi:hypothetical protein